MNDQPAFGLSTIGQIALPARDVARAEAFYRDVLGMKHLFTVPNIAFFDCGGVRLMLSGAEKPEDETSTGSILYYQVDDIHAAVGTLRERGVVFVDEPHMIAKMPDHELWMAFFNDSENNLAALMCEVR